jgi:hypothetical protein
VLLEKVAYSVLHIFRLIKFRFLGSDLKFHGPFHCLNRKVDLTRDEAENTLFQRQEQLEQYVIIKFFSPYILKNYRLRQEASVRNIAKELAAAKPIQIVHILAYRNGDGHTKPGQLLLGSSIIGVSTIDKK